MRIEGLAANTKTFLSELMVRQHAEFFIDFSAFEFEICELPMQTVAAVGLVCAWRRLGEDKAAIMSKMRMLCEVIDVSQTDLLGRVALLLRSYQTCFAQNTNATANKSFHPAPVDDRVAYVSPNCVISDLSQGTPVADFQLAAKACDLAIG